MSVFYRAAKGFAGASVSVGTAASAYVVYVMNTDPLVSPHHTFATAATQLFTNMAMVKLGSREHTSLNAVCSTAARVNQDLLMELVQESVDAKTAYAADHLIGRGITDRASFVKVCII